MCDTFSFDKEIITARVHINKSSISRAMVILLEMYLQDKYQLMNNDKSKELKKQLEIYKIYDKFDKIIKKSEDIAKEIKD